MQPTTHNLPQLLQHELHTPQHHEASTTLPPTHPPPSLAQSVASYYNQSTDGFTTPKHVVFGVHQRSLLFLLHLAVETYNKCISNTQPVLKLVIHTTIESLHQAKATPPNHISQTKTMHLHALHTSFPNTCAHNKAITDVPYPCILVAQVSSLLTSNVWQCGFAVFPLIERSEAQTVYTALRGILHELQQETGALCSTTTHRLMQLSASPMMLAYASRVHAITKGVSTCIAKHFDTHAQKRGLSCTVLPDVPSYPVYCIGIVFHYEDRKDAHQMAYVLNACVDKNAMHITANMPSNTITCKLSNGTTKPSSSSPLWQQEWFGHPDIVELVDGIEIEWVVDLEDVKRMKDGTLWNTLSLILNSM